jgi:hypothetical protein
MSHGAANTLLSSKCFGSLAILSQPWFVMKSTLKLGLALRHFLNL